MVSKQQAEVQVGYYVPTSYKGITRDLHVSVELARDSQMVRSPWLTLPACDVRPSENLTGKHFRSHFLPCFKHGLAECSKAIFKILPNISSLFLP